MLKKGIIALLCAIAFITAAVLPIGLASLGENAEIPSGFADFGDRIMYGGTAVDVGDDVVFNRDGALYKKSGDNETALLDIDGKYLNYFENELWFVAENEIMSCNADGGELVTRYRLGEEVKCLYVFDTGVMYLRGQTVCFNNGTERELFSREGICGFAPESNGNIRFIVNNPDYVPTDFNGDEGFESGNNEFFEYTASAESGYAVYTVTTKVYGTALTSESNDYFGPYVKIGETTLPLDEHMPGTYFSKNGQACSCHNTSSNYCIISEGNCNCMRYYPTGKKETCEIDLLGAQCFAFSRMVFWKCFGFIDHSNNSSLFYNVGTLANGAVTANTAKELLMKAAPGAHVRLAVGHSMTIMTMDEDFVVFYHGNAGGDGVASSPCVVSTRRYSWEQFASAAARGIQYVNMPYDYPDTEIILTKMEAGYYKLTDNLNLRAETNTSSASLAVMSRGDIVEVTELDGYWGKVEYNGKIGWIFLPYTTFYSKKTIIPSGDVFMRDNNGYLRAIGWKMTTDSFAEHFDKQALTVKAASGKELTPSDYIGTGATVEIAFNGVTVDSATLCLAGDVNQNGSLDVGDYLLIKRACLGSCEFSDAQTVASDVYGNNGTDIYDYIMIKRYFFSNQGALFGDFLAVDPFAPPITEPEQPPVEDDSSSEVDDSSSEVEDPSSEVEDPSSEITP